MSMSDKEENERTDLLVQDLEKLLKAHTDSLSFQNASYIMMRALARCIALHGLRLTVKARGNPDPEHIRRKLQGMPWAEAISAALPLIQRELEQGKAVS